MMTDELKKTVTIKIEGREIAVPCSMTVTEALWNTGYDITRGIGCLSGLCGACSMIYRPKGAKHVRFGLGCQTVVQNGMDIIMVPFYPSKTADYNISELKSPLEKLRVMYPEIDKCTQCGKCTIACPEWIHVSDAVQKSEDGKYDEVAKMMKGCIMCDLCAAVCNEDISPQYVALYIQRSLAKKRLIPQKLIKRFSDIELFFQQKEWKKLLSMNADEFIIYCKKYE